MFPSPVDISYELKKAANAKYITFNYPASYVSKLPPRTKYWRAKNNVKSMKMLKKGSKSMKTA